MPLNSGDGRGGSPEGRKSRFGGEERTSPSLQRGEHVTRIELGFHLSDRCCRQPLEDKLLHAITLRFAGDEVPRRIDT
jgi:hypothetical protein